MLNQVNAWNKAAAALGIKVDAPCEIQLADGTYVRATAHVKQFGDKNGMMVDPDWNILEPHAKALEVHGYGFSAIEIDLDHESLIEVLADWGWSAPEPEPPWLSEVNDQKSD
jgi:hypothetical protein